MLNVVSAFKIIPIPVEHLEPSIMDQQYAFGMRIWFVSLVVSKDRKGSFGMDAPAQKNIPYINSTCISNKEGIIFINAQCIHFEYDSRHECIFFFSQGSILSSMNPASI